MNAADFDVFCKKIQRTEEKEDTINSFNSTNWDYVATYLVDLRYPEDQTIIDYSYQPLDGGLDSDCYFSECVANANINDILLKDVVGGELNLKPGMYRLVFGVKVHGSVYDSPNGTEYDAWEVYELISQYRFTDKEANFHDDLEKDLKDHF